MKPVIIYALPRSRSTAVLRSCKREIRLLEPFGLRHLHKDETQGNLWNFRAELNSNFVSSGKWGEMVSKMNHINTATKILGTDFHCFLPARKWFNDCINNQTHDVFVIERENREEIFLSYIMADYFGWHETSQVDPFEFTADNGMLQHIHNIIDFYLRFYPKVGKVITFDNLPESHFDKKLNHGKSQDSASKYKYFKNIDVFRVHIKHILDYYKDEWDSKIKNLNQY